MRRFACLLALLSFSTAAAAQTRSVMIEDLTTNEVQAALNAGMTTAIYYTGGTHQSGPAVVLGKHNIIAPLLAPPIPQHLPLPPLSDDGETFSSDSLPKPTAAPEFHTPIDDASELTAIDASKYVRRDKLPPQVAPHATSAVGFTFINAKVNAAVASIRAQMAK